MKRTIFALALLVSFGMQAAAPVDSGATCATAPVGRGEKFIQTAGRVGTMAVAANYILSGLDLGLPSVSQALIIGGVSIAATQQAVNGNSKLRTIGLALLATTAAAKNFNFGSGQSAALVYGGVAVGTTLALDYIQNIK